MSGQTPIVESPHHDEVVAILQLFYPQYFDPDSPQYVDPDILTQLVLLAEEARPWCLSEERQNFAQAMYTAYLISLRQETSSGQEHAVYAGPITSEKEGDIAVTYGITKSGSTATAQSNRPSSDPWEAWNKLWSRCGRGAIMTRYGDPMRSNVSGYDLTINLLPRAYNVWNYLWP